MLNGEEREDSAQVVGEGELSTPLVPPLRFTQDDGTSYPDWETVLLGEIGDFKKGKGISKSDISEEGISCIRYGELYTTYGANVSTIVSRIEEKEEKLVFGKKNDVMIPSSGETFTDIATASCLATGGKVAIGGDIILFTPYRANGLFLSYSIRGKQKPEIMRIAQGISVVHLSSKILKALHIPLPSLPEQGKIANLLSLVDGKIENLDQQRELWREYKRGLGARLFTQEYRFTQDDGTPYPDWETVQLGEVVDFYRGKNLGKKHLSENGDKAIILYGQLFTLYRETITKVFSRTRDNGYLGLYGDVLMPTSDVTPDGLAKASCLLINNVQIGGDVNILRPCQGVDGVFLAFYLRFLKKEIIKLVSGTTIKHLYAKDLKPLPISLPTLKEQGKIANLLSLVDGKIESLDQQHKLWREYKQALLQRMFV